MQKDLIELGNQEFIESKVQDDQFGFNSKIVNIQGKYFFHELIKHSHYANHFIVEDEYPQYQVNSVEDTILYMKQNFYSSYEQFRMSLDYYKRLHAYCLTPFSKNDIVNLRQIWDIQIQEQQYYETIILYEYGESDRIDVSRIEHSHITNFLKNICILLEDLKKLQKVYHGNISLKNIILCRGELKLGGFKPIIQGNEKSWKIELSKKYGNFRLDLVLVGLLWMEFLGINRQNWVFEKSIEDIKLVFQENENLIKQYPIIQKLIDFENFPKLSVDEVITMFEESFILENFSIQENKNPFNGFRGSIDTKKRGSKNSGDNNPFQNEYNSNNNSKMSNQGDLQNQQREDQQEEQFFKLDNFTLQEDESDQEHNEPIEYFNVKKQQKEQGQKERRSINPEQKQVSFADALKVSNSEKNINKMKKSVSFKNVIDQIKESEVEFSKLSSDKELSDNSFQDKNNILGFEKKQDSDDLPNEIFNEDNQQQQDKLELLSEQSQNNLEVEQSQNMKQKSKQDIKQIKNEILSKKEDQKKKDSNSINLLAQFLTPIKKTATKTDNNDVLNPVETRVQSLSKVIEQPLNQDKGTIIQNQIDDSQNIQIKQNNEKNIDEKISQIQEQNTPPQKIIVNDQKSNQKPKKLNLQNVKPKIKSNFPIKKKNNLEERQKLMMKRAQKRLSFNQKDSLFQYNQKMNNKNIPFKQVYKMSEKKIQKNQKKKSNNLLQQNEQELKTQRIEEKVLVKEGLDFCPQLLYNAVFPIYNDIDIQFLFKLFVQNKVVIKNLKYFRDQKQDLKKQEKEENNQQELLDSFQENYQSFYSEVQLQKFIQFCETKQIKKAQELLKQIFQEFKNIHKIYLYKLAIVIAKLQNEFDKGILFCNEALIFMKNNTIEYSQNYKRQFLFQMAQFSHEQEIYEVSLNILQKRIFEGYYPHDPSYYQLKAKNFFLLNQYDISLNNYRLILRYYFDYPSIIELESKIFSILNQIFEIFEVNPNTLEEISFYHEVKMRSKRLSELNFSQFGKQIELIIKYWIDSIHKEQSDFLIYLLNDIHINQIIDFENLTENDIKYYGDLYMKFSSKIRESKNFIQDKCQYARFLKQAKHLYKKLPQQKSNQKTILSIAFREGTFYLNDGQNEKAQSHFSKCLEEYKKLYKEPGEEFSLILYQIALSYKGMSKFSYCEFYLEQILENSNENWEITRISAKLLIETYYVLGKFKNCKILSEHYLSQNSVQTKESMNEFFKLVAYYQIASLFFPSKFSTYLNEIKQQINIETDQNLVTYFSFIYNSQYTYFKKRNNKENFENLEKINLIMKANSKNQPMQFIDFISRISCVIIFDDKNSPLNTIYKIFEILNIKQQQDITNLINMLLVFYFICYNLLIYHTDSQLNSSQRIRFLKHINSLQVNKKLSDYLMKLLYQSGDQRIIIQKELEKTEKLNKTINKSKVKNKKNEKIKKISSVVIKSWNYEQIQKCSCSAKMKNHELINLINLFFKQIKNLLFLNMTKKIIEYYDKFIQVLEDQKQVLGKYEYVKILFEQYEISLENENFQQDKFYKSLDQIFNEQLCIHDYDMILYFLEAFRNMRFIEHFIKYLDQNQSQLASKIFRKLILKDFHKKFNKLVFQIEDQIQKSNFYQMENSPLLYLLGKDIQNFDRKLSFHFFQKFRYYKVIDLEFNIIFKKYFSKEEILDFNLQWQLYNLMVNLVRLDKESNYFLNQFTTGIKGILKTNLKINGDFFIKVLMAFYLVKFSPSINNEIQKEILKIINLLSSKTTTDNIPQMILLLSNISNLFFQNNLKSESLKIKRQSYDMAQSIQIQQKPQNWDLWFKSQDLDLKHFEFITSLLENDSQIIEQRFQILQSTSPEKQYLKIENLLIKCLYYLYKKQSKETDYWKEQAKIEIDKLSGFTKNLYQAILDAIFESKIDSQNDQIIQELDSYKKLKNSLA